MYGNGFRSARERTRAGRGSWIVTVGVGFLIGFAAWLFVNRTAPVVPPRALTGQVSVTAPSAETSAVTLATERLELEAAEPLVEPAVTPHEEPATLRTRSLRIVCEDSNGVPAPGCFVVARTEDGEQLVAGLTDALGFVTFEFPAELERVVVRAELDGMSSGDRAVFLERTIDFEVHDAAETSFVRLVLHPFVTVRGRVVTETETAVLGATVSARVRGIVIGGAANAPAGPVLTDAAGAFELRLDGVPGRVAVEASLGELSAKAATVVLPSGAGEFVELVLQESHYEVSGVVRAPTGCDASGATVMLLALQEGRSSQTTETDSGGAFLFVLDEPGEFRLARVIHALRAGRPKSLPCSTFRTRPSSTTCSRSPPVTARVKHCHETI